MFVMASEKKCAYVMV